MVQKKHFDLAPNSHFSDSSSSAMPAPLRAAIENRRAGHDSRDFIHISNCNPANVKQIPAIPDQIIVIQFIFRISQIRYGYVNA